MAKQKIGYVCTECGAESAKWAGRCESCGSWNTLTEQILSPEPSAGRRVARRTSAATTQLSAVNPDAEIRQKTGIAELDRVLGGGIVAGSLVLISGEPGIGKSTLLLEAAARSGLQTLYISGEESPRQIKLRADRLKADISRIRVCPETDAENIAERVLAEKPEFVVIDSVQTVSLEGVNSSAGSISQVRECAVRFMHLAKDSGIPVFLVGHVNKEGAVAGPKVLEHTVDAVLVFEGDRNTDLRILRAAKNRFGSTNEIGVFAMTSSGLEPIENPSALFMESKPENVSGIAAVCTMEGSRPLIAEVQTLVAQTPFPVPRRVANGFDYSRLNLLLAVLEKRCGMFFGTSDAYLNVIGGLRLTEPAADLAVAVALASGLKDFVIPADTLLIGEVGLAGEVRGVSNMDRRLAEAERVGFRRCIIPARNHVSVSTQMELVPVCNIRETLNKL